MKIEKLAKRIRHYGLITPTIIDGSGRIIAGAARVEAAKLLGLTEIPAIRVTHLSDAETRALRIADNRLVEEADWMPAELRIELQELQVEIDLTLTAFDVPEIDFHLGLANEAPDADTPETHPLPDRIHPVVSRQGDIWQLGSHRLICADTLHAESIQLLMSGEKAAMIWTDPPYNVAIDGNVTGLGATRHREFVMGSGEFSDEEFIEFLRTFCARAREAGAPGALAYICMDWRHLQHLLAATLEMEFPQANLIVWAKTNGGMGSFYRSRHELIGLFRLGGTAHRNNVQLGKYGRNRTNVWTYPGVNTFREGRLDDLSAHPTVKPVAMIADAILDCTAQGDIVFDGFGGSGSTILAADETGRRAYVVELDPAYVDVAIRRWQQRTGFAAIHANTGLTFQAMTSARACRDRRAPGTHRAQGGANV